MLLIFLVEMVYEFYALIVSFQGLVLRKGLNKQVRKSIFRRQVLLVVIRIVSGFPGNLVTAKIIIGKLTNSEIDEVELPPIINAQQSTHGISDYLSVGRGVLYFVIVASD